MTSRIKECNANTKAEGKPLNVRRKHTQIPELIHCSQYKFENSYWHQERLIGSKSGDSVWNVHLNTYNYHMRVIRQQVTINSLLFQIQEVDHKQMWRLSKS